MSGAHQGLWWCCYLIRPYLGKERAKTRLVGDGAVGTDGQLWLLNGTYKEQGNSMQTTIPANTLWKGEAYKNDELFPSSYIPKDPK